MSSKLSFGVRKAKARPAADTARQAAAFSEPEQALSPSQAAEESQRLQVARVLPMTAWCAYLLDKESCAGRWQRGCGPGAVLCRS